MKPLTLEVFPRTCTCGWAEPDECSPEGSWNIPLSCLIHGAKVSVFGKQKRLTLAEIAAEYHQQDAYNAYWIDRATIAAVRRNEDRLATLHRFATLPSYDEEDNDV